MPEDFISHAGIGQPATGRMEFIFVYFNNHEKIIPTRRSNFHRH
jgi:hypothetical protein